MDSTCSTRVSPLKIFDMASDCGRPAYISAPMVRYSKLPFRALVREYGVDICYTPMILAKEFNRSFYARDSDFTTNAEDSPLIVQFGASSALELARAVELVAPYCSGVDLNCGCPQSWACQDGLGAQLMHEREKVAEMIQAVKQRCGPELCISAKIRIHKDLRRTIDFIHTTEAAGVSFLSVHGRTRSERTSVPVNLDAIKLIKETTSVPVVANGDVWSMDDVKRIHAYTGVDGVMAARGLLTNPALFACHSSTPWSAVERFLNHATRYSLPFKLVQHHLSEMTGSIFGKAERQAMLEQKDMIGLIDWFDDKREIARRH